MNPSDPVADDEVILRHVPGGPRWQAPPDFRISSANFVLRQNEAGISVGRAGMTTASQLMVRLGDPAAGSKIAAAVAGEIRAVGFEVVPVPLEIDAGHAEIRAGSASLDRKADQRRL